MGQMLSNRDAADLTACAFLCAPAANAVGSFCCFPQKTPRFETSNGFNGSPSVPAFSHCHARFTLLAEATRLGIAPAVLATNFFFSLRFCDIGEAAPLQPLRQCSSHCIMPRKNNASAFNLLFQR